MYRAGQPLLEFLAWRQSPSVWAVPGARHAGVTAVTRADVPNTHGAPLPAQVKAALAVSALGFNTLAPAHQQHLLRSVDVVLATQPTWCAPRQCALDERNTDNAWVGSLQFSALSFMLASALCF